MLCIAGKHVTLDLEEEKALRAIEGVGCILDRFSASYDDGAYLHDPAMFETLASVLQDAAATLAISLGSASLDISAPND